MELIGLQVRVIRLCKSTLQHSKLWDTPCTEAHSISGFANCARQSHLLLVRSARAASRGVEGISGRALVGEGERKHDGEDSEDKRLQGEGW